VRSDSLVFSARRHRGTAAFTIEFYCMLSWDTRRWDSWSLSCPHCFCVTRRRGDGGLGNVPVCTYPRLLTSLRSLSLDTCPEPVINANSRIGWAFYFSSDFLDRSSDFGIRCVEKGIDVELDLVAIQGKSVSPSQL